MDPVVWRETALDLINQFSKEISITGRTKAFCLLPLNCLCRVELSTMSPFFCPMYILSNNGVTSTSSYLVLTVLSH